MGWIVFVYRLPPQPSRHRVGVWRELRRIGALPIQQSIYILPDDQTNLDALSKVAASVEAGGGEFYLPKPHAVAKPTRTRLAAPQRHAVADEHPELLSDRRKFSHELL